MLTNKLLQRFFYGCFLKLLLLLYIYICIYIYIYIYIYIFKIFTSHLLVSGSKSFAASKVTKVTQPFSLSRFSMHLADFLIILHFSIQIFLFIFNKCWLDVFFIFKVFFKIFIALNKIIDSKISEISKQLKFLTFE